MPEPLTLSQYLNACYKADAMRSTGEDYATVSAAFASAIAEDADLKTAARAKLDELAPVERARNGKDYITHKQVKYLTDALGA